MMIVPVILLDCADGGVQRYTDADSHLLKAALLRFARQSQIFAPGLVFTSASDAARIDCALGETGNAPPRLLVQPESFDTATAAAMAAEVLARGGPHRLGLLVPFDQLPSAPDDLLAALPEASALAGSGRIVTFGKAGACAGAATLPNCDAGQAHVAAGAMTSRNAECWHSGAVLFRAGTLLSDFERHAPEILRACRAALRGVTSSQSLIHPSRDAIVRLRPASLESAILSRSQRAAFLAPSGVSNDAARP